MWYTVLFQMKVFTGGCDNLSIFYGRPLPLFPRFLKLRENKTKNIV
jgi:hypothetical protein